MSDLAFSAECLKLAKQIHRWRGLPADEIAEIADEYARLWEGQIPTDQIENVYNQWARTVGKNGKVFQPAYLLKTWDGMQEKPEKEKRKPLTQIISGQLVYTCHLCSDTGWIMVWSWGHTFPDGYRVSHGWYRALRPCSCEAINFVQRMAALDPDEWARNEINGEWARHVDLQAHGAPSPSWERKEPAPIQRSIKAVQSQLIQQMKMPQLSEWEKSAVEAGDEMPF
jgi:hypothetical protein